MTIDKAAQILRNAQPEISCIRKLRVKERRAWLEATDTRLAHAAASKQTRLRIVRDACKLVAECGGEVSLMYHSSEIRSVVERRGLRVRMVDGLAVIYKGVPCAS